MGGWWEGSGGGGTNDRGGNGRVPVVLINTRTWVLIALRVDEAGTCYVVSAGKEQPSDVTDME